MEIEIHTDDPRLIVDLFGKTQVKRGDRVHLGQLREGVALVYQGTTIRKALWWPEVILFSASVPTKLAAGILADWLYERLKGRKVQKIIIDGTAVELSEDEIQKIIQEKVTGERK